MNLPAAPTPRLAQSDVDGLLAGLGAPRPKPARTVEPFDFRRPDKFSREHVRSLRTAHEVFARDLGRALSQRLRCVVSLETLSVEQITYEDYIRSLPDPSLLAIFTMAPLPGPAVLEMSVQLGRSFIDRILGGAGSPAAMRRPTTVEAALLEELMEESISPLTDAMAPFQEVQPELRQLEFSPQFVQIVAPTDMVLLLTYQISMTADVRVDGSFSVCYPFPTLEPTMGNLERKLWADPTMRSQTDTSRPFAGVVPDLATPITVRLSDAMMPAEEIASLQPGNVLRLTHRVDEPAIVEVGDAPVMRGHVGQRGRRFVVQIVDWNQ
jgi:flagellar motor switch protein FliM